MSKAARQKTALVVGVDQYEDPQIRDLTCAQSDCAKLQGFLEYAAGFQRVEFLQGRQATSKAIADKAAGIVKNLAPGDLFLFYFAGHGVEHAGQHLLLCPGVRYQRLQYMQETIPVDMLRQETELPGIDRVFMLDACRSDLLTTRGSGNQGLSGEKALRDVVLRREDSAGAGPASHPGSMVILCSCAEGQQAGELADTQHGIFTAALLGELKDSLAAGREVSLSDTFETALADRMATLVRQHNFGYQQRPWIQRSGPVPTLLDATHTTTATIGDAVLPLDSVPPVINTAPATDRICEPPQGNNVDIATPPVQEFVGVGQAGRPAVRPVVKRKQQQKVAPKPPDRPNVVPEPWGSPPRNYFRASLMALILGIVGLPTAFVPLASIAACVLACFVLKKDDYKKNHRNRLFALFGLGLGIGGILCFLIGLIWFAVNLRSTYY